MGLSPMADAVLKRHQQNPNSARYDLALLGSMFRTSDLDRLDAAYAELEAAGLLVRTGEYAPFFRHVKPLYKLADPSEAPTPAGLTS